RSPSAAQPKWGRPLFGGLEAGDEEIAALRGAGLGRHDPPPHQLTAPDSAPEPSRKLPLALASEHQMSAGTQHPRQLNRPDPTLEHDDELEESIGERQGASASPLERNPPLRVEADPGTSGADPLGRWIDSAHASTGELAGEEEDRLGVLTADYER